LSLRCYQHFENEFLNPYQQKFMQVRSDLINLFKDYPAHIPGVIRH
jgi:hypothetical protein